MDLTPFSSDRLHEILAVVQSLSLSLLMALTTTSRAEEQPPQVINHQKLGGATALYLAAQNGHGEVVHLLIDLRASILSRTCFLPKSCYTIILSDVGGWRFVLFWLIYGFIAMFQRFHSHSMLFC